MTTLLSPTEAPAVPFAAPALARPRGLSLVRASARLWRVVDARGHVRGHLQIITHALGVRYRARRYHALTGRFRDLGDFWSADDAVDCLRVS